MMTESDHPVAILRHLLAFDLPIDVLTPAVGRLAWDVEEPLVTLTRAEIDAVLRRYAAGELSAAEVETWADLIECREDIAFDPDDADPVNDLIHELANPLLAGPLTIDRARELSAAE